MSKPVTSFDELIDEFFKTTTKSKEEKRTRKSKKAMQDLAKTNKELFDAHIKSRFYA